MWPLFKKKKRIVPDSSIKSEGITTPNQEKRIPKCPTCGRENPTILGKDPDGATVCEWCGYAVEENGQTRYYHKEEFEYILTHKEK